MNMEPHVLLELFLFNVIPRSDTNPTAHRLLDRFGSLDGVFSASVEELTEVPGVGITTANYIRRIALNMIDGIVEAYGASPLATFEQAAGMLIWMRKKDPGTRYVTIALDGYNVVIRTDRYRTETDPGKVCFEIAKNAVSSNAGSVIIGVRAGLSPPDVEAIGRSVKVADVIEISGFSAKSIIP